MPRGTLSGPPPLSNPSFGPNADLELELLARQQTTHSFRSNEDETAATHAGLSRYDASGGLSVTGETSTRTVPSPAPRSVATSSLYRREENVGRSTSEISSTLPYGDSLLQLEVADTILGAQISLPASRSSLFGSVSSLISARTVPDSLEQLNRGQPVAPSDVPLPAIPRLSLPYSPAGSFETGSSVENLYIESDSLEQLHRLYPVDPSGISLPESNSSEFVDGTDSFVVSSCNEPSRIPTPDKGGHYWKRIEPLTHFMPHLKNILPSRGRHQYAGKVTCLDYFPNTHSPQVGLEIDMNNARAPLKPDRMAHQLKKMTVVEDQTVSLRMILVEDLCPESIAMLGVTFGLDPEFFARHLNRAGYDVEDYNEVDAARWNTFHLERDFVTLTWCRPVYQNPLLTDWREASRRLSKGEGSTDGISRIHWPDSKYTTSGKRNYQANEHQLRVETNIFRQSWSLSATPAGHGGQIRATDRGFDRPLHELRSTLIPTAWQERASLCYIHENGSIPIGKYCNLAIIVPMRC